MRMVRLLRASFEMIAWRAGVYGLDLCTCVLSPSMGCSYIMYSVNVKISRLGQDQEIRDQCLSSHPDLLFLHCLFGFIP
jgi:hypothetical protein